MTLPPKIPQGELDALLAKRSPAVAEVVRRKLADIRPSVRITSQRTSAGALKLGFMDRLFKKPAGVPVLPATASKYGGRPYCENAGEIEGGQFLGQVNFAEVTAALQAQAFPIPEGLPAQGLLAIDMLPEAWKGRARWYPNPTEAAAQETAAPTFARYEAALSFLGDWSVRGLEWFDDLPKDDGELWDGLNELQVPGTDDDAHTLFGHAHEILNENYGFVPAPGRSDNIREYALVWRIAFDNAADFAWGTNWIYLIIHREDLAVGDFGRTVLTAANA